MVDIVQVIQAARHTTLVTVEIGLAAQIVKFNTTLVIVSLVLMEPPVVMIKKMFHYITAIALTTTVVKTVKCPLSTQSLVLKHQAVYYPMYSVILRTPSKKIKFNRLSVHAPSWPLIRATSSSLLDIMVYVGQGRMHDSSITANAPLVISTVRMASVSTNVLRSTLLNFFQLLILWGVFWRKKITDYLTRSSRVSQAPTTRQIHTRR